MWLGLMGGFHICRPCCDLSGERSNHPSDLSERLFCFCWAWVVLPWRRRKKKNCRFSSPFWCVIRKVCFRLKGKGGSDLVFSSPLSPASVCWWIRGIAEPVEVALNRFPRNAALWPIRSSCCGPASLGLTQGLSHLALLKFWAGWWFVAGPSHAL